MLICNIWCYKIILNLPVVSLTFFDDYCTAISLLPQPVSVRRERQRSTVFEPIDSGLRITGDFDFQYDPLAFGHCIGQQTPAHDGRKHVLCTTHETDYSQLTSQRVESLGRGIE